MSKVFICYRREDTAAEAGRIYDRLVRRFGKEHVFMDTGDIAAGMDFKKKIDDTLRECSAMLVVIGDRWLAKRAGEERARLFAPGDHVRHEIVEAFEHKLTVIPVLVRDAQMPQSKDLPRRTTKLAMIEALPLRHQTFDHDFKQLVSELEPVLAPASSAKKLLRLFFFGRAS